MKDAFKSIVIGEAREGNRAASREVSEVLSGHSSATVDLDKLLGLFLCPVVHMQY